MPGLFRLILTEGPGHTELGPLWERSLALLAGSLERSRAAGVVRDDLVTDDLQMIISMVYGVVAGPTGRGDHAAVTRAMDLIIDGLRPRP